MTDTPSNDEAADKARGRAARPAAWVAAAGMGIGSAALVAALLYSGRGKPRDDRKAKMPPAMEKDQPES